MKTKPKDTVTKMGMIDVLNQLKSAKKIALFCHVNPDCDTIGSALALKFSLEKIGKKTDVFCDGEMKGSIAELKGADTVNAEKDPTKYDLSVAVDCGDQGRVGAYYSLFIKSAHTACIDHHKQLGHFADVNWVEPASGATAELIYLIACELGENVIDNTIATLLYTALVTDTGNFSFSCTSSRTLKIASELLTFGVKNADISSHFFKEIELPVFKLKARGISKAQFFENNAIGVLSFLKDDLDATGTVSADSSNLVNEVINIAGVRIAVSITEVRPHSFKMSVRTTDDVDASAIATVFGGGGHRNAAGFMMNGFYGNVLDDVLKACKDHL